MRKSEKKATPIRFHEGLQQLRKDAGGMDIGAREIGWMSEWKMMPNRSGALRHSRQI
jgi:hypothetical protein